MKVTGSNPVLTTNVHYLSVFSVNEHVDLLNINMVVIAQ
jgi:hypothetical protein